MPQHKSPPQFLAIVSASATSASNEGSYKCEEVLNEQLYAIKQEELLQTVRRQYSGRVCCVMEHIPTLGPGQLLVTSCSL